VYGTWPGLAKQNQFDNGSLGATTDYRDVLGDILTRRARVGSLKAVFPDHAVKPLGICKQRA
jgi:uncharacterized protein (DUF1501 family)